MAQSSKSKALRKKTKLHVENLSDKSAMFAHTAKYGRRFY